MFSFSLKFRLFYLATCSFLLSFERFIKPDEVCRFLLFVVPVCWPSPASTGSLPSDRRRGAPRGGAHWARAPPSVSEAPSWAPKAPPKTPSRASLAPWMSYLTHDTAHDRRNAALRR